MKSTSNSLAEPFFGLLCKLWMSCSSASVLWNIKQIFGCSMSWLMPRKLCSNSCLEQQIGECFNVTFYNHLRYIYYFTKNRAHKPFFHDVPPVWPVELKTTFFNWYLIIYYYNIGRPLPTFWLVKNPCFIRV